MRASAPDALRNAPAAAAAAAAGAAIDAELHEAAQQQGGGRLLCWLLGQLQPVVEHSPRACRHLLGVGMTLDYFD